MALQNIIKITQEQAAALQNDTHTPKQITVGGTTYVDDSSTVFVVGEVSLLMYSPTFPSYSENMVVFYGGYLFMCAAANGAGTQAGSQTPNPSADTDYWIRVFA